MCLAGCASVASQADADVEEEVAVLADRISALEARLSVQEDLADLRKLAFSYGYYMDNALYEEVRDLFSENIESCEVSGYGKFLGSEGCGRMWSSLFGAAYGGNENKLSFGSLAKHYLIKDVITVNKDGTANGRFDYFSVGGKFGAPERTRHQVGIYRMGFIKEGGIWKIAKFHLTFDTINYNFSDWATNPGIRCPKAEVTPDAPGTPYHPFPETAVVPFHYPNPVTGKDILQHVTDSRYWVGNWPGEFGGPCGKIDASK